MKNIVAKRDNNRIASVFRSSKIFIKEGDDERGGTEDDEAVDDDASLFAFGEESEFAEISSTRTIVLIECIMRVYFNLMNINYDEVIILKGSVRVVVFSL